MSICCKRKKCTGTDENLEQGCLLPVRKNAPAKKRSISYNEQKCSGTAWGAYVANISAYVANISHILFRFRYVPPRQMRLQRTPFYGHWIRVTPDLLCNPHCGTKCLAGKYMLPGITRCQVRVTLQGPGKCLGLSRDSRLLGGSKSGGNVPRGFFFRLHFRVRDRVAFWSFFVEHVLHFGRVGRVELFFSLKVHLKAC